MSGHGWVTPNPGGGIARCGGPPMCAECCREIVMKQAQGDGTTPVVAKNRTDLLTTTQMYHLDQACELVSKAFGGECPYLVGTAGLGGADSCRDVDVRLMLDGEEFAAACPTRERWELLCLAVGAYLASRTGLPVDFQIQSARVANELHGSKPRNPLGMGGRRSTAGRVFAGGGDGTPAWETVPGSQDKDGAA